MGFIKLLAVFVLGVLILAGAVYAIAEDPKTFLNLPGLALVFGGTLIATFISYPLNILFHAFRAVERALKKNPYDLQQRISIYAEAMISLKKGNLQDAEKKITDIHSPYLETAARMMIDGTAKDDILRVLDWQLEKAKSADRTNAAVFLTMAGYAPAFGMVGTLIGLVNMLDTMQSGDFQLIGSNMAVALITTFYGILLANILFKPLAVKLEQKMHEDTVLMTVAKEAVTYLSEGRPPAYTKDLLHKYLEETEHRLID
jgi:chemotaxis protein MotA